METINDGETKQLKQSYYDHIFLSMLKGMRTLFALEMWLSTSSMKNYNPLRTALKTRLSGCHKIIRDDILENIMTENLIQPIEDVLSIIDSNLRIFHSFNRFSLCKHLR